MDEQTLLEQWQQRLAEMKLQLSQPSQLAWYYEIQARILTYLISRYENSPSKWEASSGQSRLSESPQSPCFRTISSVHPEVRDRTQIRTILSRIADVSGQHPDRCSNGWSIFE